MSACVYCGRPRHAHREACPIGECFFCGAKSPAHHPACPSVVARAIHRHILARLALFTGPSSGWDIGERAVPLVALECEWFPRETTRAVCRDLTDRGMAHFMRGLFTDDGYPAGAGYGITRRGLRYLAALDEAAAQRPPTRTPAERQSDRYLCALQELMLEPRITIAEHVAETPWLEEILTDAARRPRP